MNGYQYAVINRNTFKELPDRKPEAVPQTPRKLYVEATSYCNLNCEMCFRKSWINEKHGNIRADAVLRVFDEPMFMESVQTVFFGGMGEPLIHPDIMKMIAAVKAKGKRVEIISNGTSIDRERAAKLIGLGVDELWISIDSFDSEGYERIQVGSSFAEVVRNIRAFNELRRGTDVKLGLTFVLMKSNILQLTAFERFTEDMLADDVNISNMIPNVLSMESETLAYQTIFEDNIHPHYYDKEKTQVAMIRMTEDDLVENPGIERLLDRYRTLLWRGKPLLRRENSCRFITDGCCFLRWDGEVMPCMGLLHSAHTCLHGTLRTVMSHSFGSIYNNTLTGVWNSEAYAKFRERVAAFNFAPCTFCGGCARREGTKDDCINTGDRPVCSACLWGQGVARCP